MYSRRGSLALFVLACGIVLFVLWIVVCTIWWYNFKVGCQDYLKLAGDAPTVQKADEFLGKALNYLEARNLTSGNSGIVFRYPADDVGIWYQQIKGAKATLASILQRSESGNESINQLERDNALMKVREVVLDQGEKGTVITAPNRISWFPSQVFFFLWMGFALLLMSIGGVWVYKEYY